MIPLDGILQGPVVAIVPSQERQVFLKNQHTYKYIRT